MNSPKNGGFKAGLIGCGRATASLHLPALKVLDGVEVTALDDSDQDALQKLGDSNGIEGRYSSVEQLLDGADVDLVAVCVPVTAHLEVASACIRAGKHVLIEKPLAIDLQQCDEMIQLGRQSDKVIAVGFNLRWHRLVREARTVLQSGALGEIEAVRSRWTSAIRLRQAMPDWRNSRTTGGGSLFEIAVHHFDLWRFLLDTEVTQVNSLSRSGRFDDESVVLTAELENGALANGLFSEHTSDANELEICGREGTLGLSLFRYDGLTFTPADSEPGLAARSKQLLDTALGIPKGLGIMRRGGDFLLSYQSQWKAFLEAAIEGNHRLASLQDGRAAVAAVLAANQSAEQGVAVAL